MKKIKENFFAILLVFLLLMLLLSLYLFSAPNDCSWKYFMIPFKDLVNIFVISAVIYWFVEYKNDKRSQKLFMESIAKRIIFETSESCMYQIKNKRDVRHNLILCRIIYNELEILEKCQDEFEYKEDLKYCKEDFKGYWDILSENVHDIKLLQEKENDLENQLGLVINKTETIMKKLYSD